MEQRTCPVCGKSFTPRSANQRYCEGRGPCYRKATNAEYRSTTEAAACKECGTEFERTRGSGQVYCSDDCHRLAKAKRGVPPRVSACPHGWGNVATCPACTFMARAERAKGFRNLVRSDPCAYCGERPSQGLDHIDPRVVDRGDPSNWTGCCKRCNETKRALPLLLALPWIPVSRRYHDHRRALFS